ncbi:nucleobase:cation symporter-2 family protein [Aerococcus agrisoli]|uniref:nucleobase:cation symporter-2 family protein n=1 Tax=Aerococcus agrisoli TaxID=2487350 RepID=UPI001F1D3A7D|nr:nucleobase:cation symporter-2 family protein [Aerococcus agrisoli]
MKNIDFKDIFGAKTTFLSLQHLLAMYAGAIVVPLIVSSSLNFTTAQTLYLVSADIVISGIATFLQLYRGKFIGIGLPVVMACSFTAIGPMIKVGSQYGLSTMFGSILAAGVIIMLLAPIFAKLSHLFPPLVTGTIVTLIGATLIPVAINNLAGGQGSADFGNIDNLVLGLITFLIILFLYRYTKGFLQSISILIGLVAGMIIAIFMGKMDMQPILEASWFQLPMPFAIAAPSFNLSAIISLTIVGIISMIEVTGIDYALAGMYDKDIDEADLRRSYFSVGIGYMLAGIFNTSPQTAFSQNVGVVQMSGQKRKSIFINLIILMLICGLLPKIGAIATAVPAPVLGGAMIFLFGNVLSYGISVLGAQDLSDNRNQLMIGAAITIGLGVSIVPDAFAQLPEWLSWLTSSGIVAGAVTVVLLNAFFHGVKK